MRGQQGCQHPLAAAAALPLRTLRAGGDSGIGRAVAVHFAREGADVAILYLDEHTDADEVVALVEKEGRKCLKFSGDVSKPEVRAAAAAGCGVRIAGWAAHTRMHATSEQCMLMAALLPCCCCCLCCCAGLRRLPAR